MLSGSDGYVFIPGPPLGTYTRKITRREYIESTRYNESWYKAAKKANLRGVRMTFGYVGRDIANLLGRSVADVVEHQLRGSLVSFEKIARKAKEIAKLTEEGAQATLASDGMKLNFELKGNPEIQDGITDGEDLEAGNNVCYVPPGYVETEVKPSSVSGAVKLSPSLTRFGKLDDATIEFEGGKLVAWTSRASPEVIRRLAEVLPERSPKLAALVVGLNPAMKLGFGQDRFPAGSVSLLLGFTGILRRASLEVGGKTLVKNGRLT
jgi:leucyl aminopeptidase (aminopeptidase T)